MTDLSRIAALLNRLPFDIRTEVVAADLIEQGIRMESIIYKPVSTFKRQFSTDLLNAIVTEDNTGEGQMIFEVSRDGIYDILPEGLFHHRLTRSGHQNPSVAIEDAKNVKAEEKYARLFFQPMENELFHLRTEVERAERKMFFDLEQNKKNDLLIRFWQLEEFIEYPTLPFLVRLIPLIYRLSSNMHFMQTCYELLLGEPVDIKIVHSFKGLAVPDDGWELGNNQLGLETIPGKEIADDLPSYHITIGPLATEEIPDFLPQGKMLPYLDLINSYFLPAGYDVYTNIIPSKNECLFDLSGDKVFLGVNSYLC